jgi:hypothetical protein
MGRNFYDVLGVPPNATPGQIRQAYLLLNKMLHPDRFDQIRQPKEWRKANEMLIELNQAYGALRDPTSRARYDRTLDTPAAAAVPAANSPTPPPTEQTPDFYSDYDPTVPQQRKSRARPWIMAGAVCVTCLLALPYTCTEQETIDHSDAVVTRYETKEVPVWGQIFFWTFTWSTAAFFTVRIIEPTFKK